VLRKLEEARYPIMDAVYVAIFVVFFALTWGFYRLMERL
jgi:hypothetical protein